MDIVGLTKRLRMFSEAREWEQFHSPKNLAMALSVEAAELAEIFQWLTEEQSRSITSSSDDMRRVREELADVQIYLLRLADVLDVDLEQAVTDKIDLNERKYPIDLAKGTAQKYDRPIRS
jgi:dCTP diphosphatase